VPEEAKGSGKQALQFCTVFIRFELPINYLGVLYALTHVYKYLQTNNNGYVALSRKLSATLGGQHKQHFEY